MSTPTPPPTESYSDSSDSMIVEVIGPADFVPRPLTGKKLEIARAEWEKLQRYRREKEDRESAAKQKAERERDDQPPKSDG